MNGTGKKSVMSKVAIGAVAGGLALGLLGAGAGVASADPGPHEPHQHSQQDFDHDRDDQLNQLQRLDNRLDWQARFHSRLNGTTGTVSDNANTGPHCTVIRPEAVRGWPCTDVN